MAFVDDVAVEEWTRCSNTTGRRLLYLQPGRLFVSLEPAVITTILGSCVAICLWDATLRAGGMNHYMLPFETSPAGSCARFGSVACRELIRRMIEMGTRRERLRAAVFGGACVVGNIRVAGEHVGTKNVDLADALLAEERILVVHRDVAGRRGRKVCFETDSGRFTVRAL